MKTKILLTFAALAAIASFLILASNRDHAASHRQTRTTTQSELATKSSDSAPILHDAKLAQRPEDQPFWEKAEVPDHPVVPETKIAPTPATNRARSLADIRRAVRSSNPSALNPDELATLNSDLAAWHSRQPSAATDWMQNQNTAPLFQDAIERIAYDHAASGRIKSGLDWSNRLIENERRHLTSRRIVAIGYAHGMLNKNQVRHSGLSPADQNLVLSRDLID